MAKKVASALNQQATTTLKRALTARRIPFSAVSCQYQNRGRHIDVMVRYSSGTFNVPILVDKANHLSASEADEIAGAVRNEIALTMVVNRYFGSRTSLFSRDKISSEA